MTQVRVALEQLFYRMKTNRVCNPCPNGNWNPLRSNRKTDAGDRFLSWEFQQYAFGRHVNVESDHKPLETILQKPLVRAPRRLQSMMMRLQKYDFNVHYERGTNMHLADTLSRAYLPFPGKEEDDIESVNMVHYLPISDKRLDEIRMETLRDQWLRSLSETILVGWPYDKKDAPPLTHPYFSIRDELTVQDKLIFKGNAVIIPRNLRAAMKAKIHSSHLGIEACLRWAGEYLCWPAMSAEIKEYISACEICRELDTTSQTKETLMSHEVPSRPWEKIAADISTLDGKDYLVTIDYYSNFWQTVKYQSVYHYSQAEESFCSVWNSGPSSQWQWPTV